MNDENEIDLDLAPSSLPARFRPYSSYNPQMYAQSPTIIIHPTGPRARRCRGSRTSKLRRWEQRCCLLRSPSSIGLGHIPAHGPSHQYAGAEVPRRLLPMLLSLPESEEQALPHGT